MKAVIVLLSFLVLVASLPCLADDLPRERQLEVIENYMYITGQRGQLPSMALDDDGVPLHELPIKCGTPAIVDWVNNYDKLDKDLLKSLGASLWQRPTHLADSLDSPDGWFRIHYTTTGNDAVYQAGVDNNQNGVPDFVEDVADICDEVYHQIIVVRGYPAPPPDGYEPGGDEKYDVYLRRLGRRVYGYTYPDSIVFIPGVSVEATSFIEINGMPSDLDGYENRPLDAVRVTLAHEFFHAVQFGIDYCEGEGSFQERIYWMEMSAVWMEEELFDDINDYYNYLEDYFHHPGVSLQYFTTPYHAYSSVIFPIFLSEKYGRDIIRDIWMGCAEPGPSFLHATDSIILLISDSTQNWASTFSEFALWNYFTGERSYLNPIQYKTTFWKCNHAGFPPCNDSTQVFDPLGDWDFWHEDTLYVTGYSEKEFYPTVPYSAIVREDHYPVDVYGYENPNNPQHNSTYYLRFEELRTLLDDTTLWVCNDGAFPECLDSTEVTYDIMYIDFLLDDTTFWVCNDGAFPECLDSTEVTYDIMYIDSLFSPILALGDGYHPAFPEKFVPTLPQGWGFNAVFQTEANPDSFIVDRFLLPDDSGSTARIFHPRQYRSIAMILSPASPYRMFYDTTRFRIMQLGYQVHEHGAIDSNLIDVPSAILLPFPNPVVVARLDEPRVQFKFQVPTDSASLPIYGKPYAAEDPYLMVDIYTLAGEYVKTEDKITRRNRRLGLYYTEWDLKNASGRDVASGVYLVYARLYSKTHKGLLLAEDRAKVAVIR